MISEHDVDQAIGVELLIMLLASLGDAAAIERHMTHLRGIIPRMIADARSLNAAHRRWRYRVRSLRHRPTASERARR